MMLPLWERGCRMETKSPSIYEFECDQGWKVKIELHQSRYGSNTPSWVLSDSCKNKAWQYVTSTFWSNRITNMLTKWLRLKFTEGDPDQYS